MTGTDELIEAVGTLLDGFDRAAVAVSGGIDSLTLSTIAGRRLRDRAQMFHALSPAVPEEATGRVRDLARREHWRLRIVDAAEFGRAEYVANPVNRCFYCKQSLYSRITGAAGGQILSGTNADDLHDYRPGLDAAREAKVRHPFAELGIGKPAIRVMARSLGLGDLAELPASPCLSSRVETGIGITAGLLARIHAAEKAVRASTGADVVRCRYRRSGIVIEIGSGSLSQLTNARRNEIAEDVRQIFDFPPCPVTFADYRVGSAFLVDAR